MVVIDASSVNEAAAVYENYKNKGYNICAATFEACYNGDL